MKSKLWAAPPGGPPTAWPGTAVARRVQVVGGSNTRYYLHSDHLGSTSLATTTAGSLVAGSTARYTSFGGWRTEPTANLTDRDFTGQRENRELGLLYYQARYYLPGIGRFASADSLVPDPANPQAYNRYTYSLNSPLRFVDPTGHRTCTAVQAATGDETCNQNIIDTEPLPPPEPPTQPCLGNKTCTYIPDGVWHISMYIYATESDAATDPRYYGKTNESITTMVCYNGTTGCAERTFSYRFLYGAEGVIQQGTGITSDGRYIHPGDYNGHWVYREDGSKDYFVPDNISIHWGAGREVIPHISVAVGPAYNSGVMLYVPDLAHTPNGGYFVVADTGGGITNHEMDIFVGNGLAAYRANKSVYFGPVGTWESADLEVFRVLTVSPRGVR